MSISLKYVGDTISNHESRIKALEDKFSTGVGKLVRLSGNNGVLSQPMTNFDILYFRIKYSGNDGIWMSCPVSVFRSLRYIRWDERGGQNADRYYGTTFDYKSDTQVGAGNGGYASLVEIYGLKVYYTFSIILTLILSNFLNIFNRKEVI